ncbi:chondroitin proteoglycan 1 [Drosophila kikkawai]|uniref:Chondroitin proteoglycan 1 n=1 Tax=Drosophila kikkawai TaxID=30033 RepID=A0ABM4GH05_DROKI
MDSSFCSTLSNGYYEYPYDCGAYIWCNDSCADLEYCPDGKLFNSPLHICDTPEAVKCTPLPNPANPCKDESNHTILPSALSCSEFIVCLNGQSEEKQCPGELLFNPDLKICDFKDNVVCFGDQTTQDEHETTTTTEEPFTECEGQKLGAMFPDIRNCQQYYYCWGNDSYSIFPCPVDNWFNLKSGNCGPDISPEACREVVTTSPPLTTVATTTTVSDKENPCADQELGASFPLQSDCQQYLLCLGGGKSTTAKCPVNAWFDPDTGDCGPNVSPTACLDAFTTSTTVTTTKSSEDVCADQELGASYPLVTNCQQYILCMGDGKSTVANCIYNGFYDPQTGNCGPEVSPTACKETGVSTESSTSEASTTPSPTTPLPTISTTLPIDTTTNPADILGICSGHGEDYYATYPDECSKYIACAQPVPIAFYCPQSLFFNEALQKCVEWESSDCPKGETTTLSPGLTTPAPEVSLCFNNSGQNLPYLDNCQWFIRCVDDSSYMMGICSLGEFFDPLTGECGSDVSPDACRENYNTTTSTTSVTDTTESSTTAVTPSTPSTEIHPCEGVPNGKLVPYPDDCTKFIACVQPYPLVYDCVVGQEFSAALERCMAPWYANCSIILTTTQTPLTSTTEAEDTTLPNSFCDDKSEGTLVPYPNNCSKYIVCQEPIPVGFACPEDEEFSPIDFICMDAQLAKCNSTGYRLHSPDLGFFSHVFKAISSFSFDF